MRYVGSLIAGVAVFCFGAGVTLLNGVVALVSADNTLQYSYLIYAFISLGFGFLTESVTFVMAVIATWKGAKKSDTSVMHYGMLYLSGFTYFLKSQLNRSFKVL
jgi:zinc transporter 9